MRLGFSILILLPISGQLQAQEKTPYGTCEDGATRANEDAAKGKYELLSYGLPFCDD